jgi:hypothetical protein
MNLGKNYKVFSGDARNSMPALLKEGYIPLSVNGILKNRYKEKDFSDWKDNYFDTIDGTIYNTRGDAKIVLDADYIKALNPSTQLREGAVVFDDGTFENTIGVKVLYLPKDKKEKLHNKNYTQESVKDSEVWNFLARDNKFLSDYADEFFPEMKERFNIKNAMELYFDSASDFEKGRAWYVYVLEYRSNANARVNFDNDFGQFAGFSGGATGEKKKLEKEVLVAPNFKQIIKLGKDYVPKAIQKEFEEKLREIYKK